jgi:chemotaxis protein histidine kinase CheA
MGGASSTVDDLEDLNEEDQLPEVHHVNVGLEEVNDASQSQQTPAKKKKKKKKKKPTAQQQADPDDQEDYQLSAAAD